MMVSVSKTVWTIFGKKRPAIEKYKKKMSFQIDGNELEYDSNPTFLGVKFDEKLTMD